MKENLSPEERALRGMDGTPKVSEQDQQGLSDLTNAGAPKESGLGRVEQRDHTKETVRKTDLQYGYFTIDSKDFPSQGKFYPTGTIFKIKAATVKDIRTFSALDEENPYEVDDALVELLSNNVRVAFPDRGGSWKDVLEEDRLSLILSIRELTFAEDENKIAFKVKCESCGTENDMEIVNDNFQKRELNEKISKYYSETDKQFNVETKSYGTINIKPPSIGIMRIVHQYIKALQEAKKNVKEYLPFLKTVPYMIEEWRSLSVKDLENYRMEFLRWDKKKYLTFTQLVELAQISVKEKMRKPCSKCGDPIEADVELPTGIKGLFIEEGILDDELL